MTECRWKLGANQFAVVNFDREPTWDELDRMAQYVALMQDATNRTKPSGPAQAVAAEHFDTRGDDFPHIVAPEPGEPNEWARTPRVRPWETEP